ncbi:MAG: radical SAM protein [Phycisphaerales bacterium]|nr:radical SAM protein [Phycisphaerales bacterium]
MTNPSLFILPSNERVLKETRSVCPNCLEEVAAKVVERDGAVWMLKHCAAHGAFETRLESHPSRYYATIGNREGNTQDSASCCGGGGCCGAPMGSASVLDSSDSPASPFDVLSTCVALIEIVDSCNLACPTCFASSPLGEEGRVDCTPFDVFVEQVSNVIARKGFIDILQLSGGEPTIHPEFERVLEWALAQEQIGYVLVNTNLVRIDRDCAFRERLGALRRARGKFELYAQFDGTQLEGQKELRGADLRALRARAIDAAGALGIPTTLAMTVTRATLSFIGDALAFGFMRPHVRGMTLQPVFVSGRIPALVSDGGLPLFRTREFPISVGELVHACVTQSAGVLSDADFTPLPCGDPNCHTIGYALRVAGESQGISRFIDVSVLQGFLKNRVDYRIEDLAQCGCETEPLGQVLKEIESRVGSLGATDSLLQLTPEMPFRIFIKPFMDAFTFDQDRIDRCCTHVIRSDGSLDSFCHYYLHGGKTGFESQLAVERAR